MSVRTHVAANPKEASVERLQPRFPCDYFEYDHEYERRIRERDDVQQIATLLRKCSEAMVVERDIEKALYNQNILAKKKPLVLLEKTLLEMAAYPDMCQGIFYCCVMQLDQHTVVRFIEGGQYHGFMTQRGETLLCQQLGIAQDDLLKWRIYTANDIEEYKMVQLKRRNKPEERTGRQKTKDNNRQVYARYLRTEDKSVIKNLEPLKTALNRMQHEAGGTVDLRVPFLVIHTLKTDANDAKEDDRYIHVHGTGTTTLQSWITSFQDHIVNGAPDEDQTMSDLFHVPTEGVSLRLVKQFEILSSISNYHWWRYPLRSGGLSSKKSFVGLGEQLLYQPDQQGPSGTKGPKYPTRSPRNRLMHFTLEGNASMVNLLIRTLYGLNTSADIPPEDTPNTDEDIEESCPRPIRRRGYSRRSVTITTEDILQDMNISPSDVVANNMTTSHTVSVYQSYVEKLMGCNGVIVWRLHTDDQEQVILNDFHPVSGTFMPSSYVQVTHLKGETPFFQCTCRIYAYLCSIAEKAHIAEGEHITLSDTLTCVHCRFYKEQLLPFSSEWSQHQQIPSGNGWLQKKLQNICQTVNIGVVPIGHCDARRTVCLSVRSAAEEGYNCAFVHLSGGQFVACQAGICVAMSRHKKKASKLISLNTEQVSLLCGHLQMLCANQDVWAHMVHQEGPTDHHPQSPVPESDNTEDSDIYIPASHENAEPSTFNAHTGLWDFGGISTHAPAAMLDEKLIRCTQLRLSICSLEMKDGFLCDYKLVPEVPSSCPCGAGFQSAEGCQGCQQEPCICREGFAPVLDCRTRLYTRTVSFCYSNERSSGLYTNW